MFQTLELLEDRIHLFRRDARASVPDLPARYRAAPPQCQQHSAVAGVAQCIGEEILQDASQQAAVAVQPDIGHAHTQFQSACRRQWRELFVQRLRQCRGRCWGQFGPHRAGVQAGDVEQAFKQFLGVLQRAVDAFDQLPAVRVFARIGAQRGTEQARGVQRLQQVMTGAGQEAGLAEIGGLGLQLGGALRFQCGGQFAGALAHAQFEGFVGVQQGLLDALVIGHVGIGGDVAAAGHRPAAHFKDAAVIAQALEHIGRTLAHEGHALFDMLLDLARAALAALGIPADQIRDRTPDVDHAVGIFQHFQIAPVPRHQTHVGVDHADALRDVFQRRPHQLAVETQLLRGLVQQRHHFAQVHAGAAQCGGQHAPRRGGADRGRQQPLGVLQQATVGQIARCQRTAVGIAVIGKRALHRAPPDDAFGDRAQIGDRDASAPFAAGADRPFHPRIQKGQGAQALVHTGPVTQAQEHEEADVEQQRPEHAMRQFIPAGQPEQRLWVQPGLIE